MLGSDYTIDDGTNSALGFSGLLRNLDEPIKLQAKNDNVTGEIESFVLAVTGLQVLNLATGMTIEAFPGNQLTVNIADDDSEYCSTLPIVLKNYILYCLFQSLKFSLGLVNSLFRRKRRK